MHKTPADLTLKCPTAGSIGTPATFTGTLTAGPAGARLELLYEQPTGALIAHEAEVGGAFNYARLADPDQISRRELACDRALQRRPQSPRGARGVPVHGREAAAKRLLDLPHPVFGSVAPGGMTTATISTAVSSGAAQPVLLSTSGTRPGTFTIAPSSVTAGGSATLTVQTNATTTLGTYVITITGTGTSATHSTTYTLNLKAATSLSLICTPGPNHNIISCTGQLVSGAGGIVGAPLSITYQPPVVGLADGPHANNERRQQFSDSLGSSSGPPSRVWHLDHPGPVRRRRHPRAELQHPERQRAIAWYPATRYALLRRLQPPPAARQVTLLRLPIPTVRLAVAPASPGRRGRVDPTRLARQQG